MQYRTKGVALIGYGEVNRMDDLISRQAAIDEIASYERDSTAPINYRKIIEQLPPAQPDIARDIATIIEDEKDMRVILSGAERKKGKWNTYYHSDTDFTYSCNRCGYSAPYQMIRGEIFQKKWNFCPNCGSDNRGEQE